jgi:hypothetical protein
MCETAPRTSKSKQERAWKAGKKECFPSNINSRRCHLPPIMYCVLSPMAHSPPSVPPQFWAAAALSGTGCRSAHAHLWPTCTRTATCLRAAAAYVALMVPSRSPYPFACSKSILLATTSTRPLSRVPGKRRSRATSRGDFRRSLCSCHTSHAKALVPHCAPADFVRADLGARVGRAHNYVLQVGSS